MASNHPPSLSEGMPEHISLRGWAERLELALRGTDLGVWDWNLATGEVYFNNQWGEMLGYKAGELSSGYETWARIVHPDDLSRVEDILRDHLQGDTPGYEAEHRLLTKDGTWKWILTKGRVVLRDEAGKPIRAVGTHRDIHAAKTMEESLRESEGRLRSMIENSPEALAVSTDGIVAYINPAGERLFQWKAAEMEGRSPLEFLHPDDEPVVLDRLRQAAQGIDVPPRPYRVLCKSGDYVHVEARTRPLTFLGKPSTITSFYDLTHRLASQNRIEEYQHRLRSLTSELALAEERERRRIASDLHDGPVQSLGLLKIKLGALEASLDHPETVKMVREIREIADSTLQDSRSLLFDLSPPVLYELGFAAAVEWLAERLADQFSIPIKVTQKGTLPELDQSQEVVLFQLVRELLTNVGKHAKAKSAEVALDGFDGKTRVTVTDDGRGFEQLDDRGVEKSGGYGLFSIRERIDLLGGAFGIDTTPGGGTRVILWV